MNLEQRVEALEKAVSKLTIPSTTAEEMANIMQDVVAEAIKNARRPSGTLHKLDEKAAHANAAYNVSLGINCR
ncbi:hypothetical protein CRJ07_09325 [Salmonella enterica]|uniref:Uncharacterized protein n=1 Tax=Salmonella enterica subsp. enterica serovar Give TaxID=46626 RepID=A0A602RFT6_SALET|nr:hypothetical protein [Salmonella enterica]ECS9679130.1 hypothetical protein [Salmonella enterica subsp. enterica serovar Give]ELE3265021.1 hypothetical protein [Salmonella enterica subsp. enterica serovar Muenchen]EAX9909262.1 hypothetical protein [Salmonella enterica]EBT9760670.1 hypothetical protein [Salmonella enterica]